ncbi:MAG: ATP-binding protein [Proteobacteria bacterium]|nr:ATP-binding protein [Pseudomonadota bacterium]
MTIGWWSTWSLCRFGNPHSGTVSSQIIKFKRSHEKKRRNDFFRAVFEQSLDVSICIKPRSGRIIACNRALHSILGYEPKRLLGCSLLELAPDNPVGEVWDALASCLELRNRDIEVLHQNGDRKPMSASATAIWGGGGKIRCCLVNMRLSGSLARQGQPENQAYFNRLAYEISVAESRERERIARGLHDVVGQLHTMLSIKLDELKESCQAANALGLIAETRTLLDQATLATRATTFDLSNPLLNLLGLKAAIESLGQTYALNLFVEGGNEPLPLSEPVLAVVFRVVRELLFNIRKHAQARHVFVSVNRQGDILLIHITDDGVGFDVSALSTVRHERAYGLVSARAQILSLGGRIEIDSSPGAGTRISISLPLSDR